MWVHATLFGISGAAIAQAIEPAAPIVPDSVIEGADMDTYQPAEVHPAADRPAEVEFDARFFPSSTGAQIDVSRFARGNAMLPGTYLIRIGVNGEWKGREELVFVEVEGQDSAQACLDRGMLRRLGIDMRKVEAEAAPHAQRPEPAPTPSRLADGEMACGDLGRYVPGATLHFDASEQVLDLSVPQLYLAREARGYVSPEYWDSGATAAFVDYRLNATDTQSAGRSQRHGYLGIGAGFNLGHWRFRHNGSMSWSSGSERAYQSNSAYAQRDVPWLQSQLVIGDTYTSGDQFDSVRLRGLRLATDDRMLPPSRTGYAPVVRGVAETHARVSVRQRGVLLYETTVAPGPFEIDDLYPTGYGGDLDVIVVEADGRERRFAVSYAATPNLLRPGYSRYSFSAGRIREMGLQAEPYLAQATLQRGLSNAVTGYTGASASEGYSALQAGVALNTKIGALSADLTASRARLPGTDERRGESLQLRYSKALSHIGTSFSMGAYRYSNAGYLGVLDAVRLRDLIERGGSADDYGRMRSRVDLTLNQAMGAAGSLYFTGSSTQHWGWRDDLLNFTLGYANTWRRINYGVNLQRTRVSFAEYFGDDRVDETDTQVNLTFSVPLGHTPRSPTLSSSVAHSRDAGSSTRIGVTGSALEGALSYGVSGGHSDRSGSNGGVNGEYRGSQGVISASYSQGRGYHASSLGLSGGVVAHPGGITLAQSLGETIAVVHAPGAKGARVSSANGVKLDRRGYAVVPYLVPYRRNTIDLDPKGTSQDLEFKSTSQEVAPRLGAVAMLEYETVDGRSLMIKAEREDGTPLPFGAAVFDERGNHVGVVGQASRLFVRTDAEQGRLTVQWGESGEQRCQIDYGLPGAASELAWDSFLPLSSRCARTTADAEPEAPDTVAAAGATRHDTNTNEG